MNKLHLKLAVIISLLFFSFSSFGKSFENKDFKNFPVQNEHLFLLFKNLNGLPKELPYEFSSFDYQCSVTSSGVVETPNGSFTATLTVYGPCDSSLSTMMRDAIKSLRESFK